MRIDEVWGLPRDGRLLAATLVILQEDGRAAYAIGEGERDWGTDSIDLLFAAMFSDRLNDRSFAAPLTTPGPTPTNVAGQPMSIANMDVIKVQIPKLTGPNGSYPAKVELAAWGDKFNVDLTLMPGVQTYEGRGPGIGSPDPARYIVSFQGAVA